MAPTQDDAVQVLPTSGGTFGPAPPGYGPPPPAPPRRGPSGWAILASALGLVAVSAGGAGITCVVLKARKAAEEANAPKPAAAPPPVAAAPTVEYTYAERPSVKLQNPVGWQKDVTRERDWAVFTAPGGDAVLAFTTFSHPGESTRRLSKATAVLGVSNVEWRTPRYGPIGKDQFRGHVADGNCFYKGPNGYIWYATVDSGTADQILLVYTVSATAPKTRNAEARAAIDSLQRR